MTRNLISAALAATLLVGTTASAEDTPTPMAVTTDTPEFCHQLADLVDRALNPPQEAVELSADGKTLCAEGHIRGGVRRLRQAITLIEHISVEH
jgi:hypothetical protein